MTDDLTLTLTLEPKGPAGAFVLSDEQVAAVGGGRKTFPVQVTVNGVTLPLRLSKMGGENLIGLAKAARAKAGVDLGASYEVTISADEAPRAVEVPAELAAALAADHAANIAYEALAYSHRKEFVRWITEAKREATRAERVVRTVEMLKAGEHR
ncbi:hypothetical protein GCM10010172_47900 [Paractinoplanes ferrugineus]|uniref:Uncharacterized protein n=1 Tax=Paractinoplanes ferrugineus TaxID=113564 RepID=A0A919IXU6_9ACTN|nr:YdeI/OmpD-associated family protein [Actinoplanes ferrugineus]GIE11051.1 hypothetical protein Afe05nite_28910 [Actinoplanes ferrugineus]